MAIDGNAARIVDATRVAMCSAENEGRALRMLVPVDCTELGNAVLDTAACTARLLKAEVHLIAVLPPEHEHATVQPVASWYPSYGGEAMSPTAAPAVEVVEWRDQALAATRSAAEDYLQAAATRFDGLQVSTQVVMLKPVGRAIVDYARHYDVDLIAMATRGRTRIAQALLGSVAAEVVHSGVAPVLLVKPQDS